MFYNSLGSGGGLKAAICRKVHQHHGLQKMKELSREYHVLRLFQEDKDLIQGLGKKDGCSRYDALLKLIPIVDMLDLPAIKAPKRYPVRVGIPTELKRAIKKAKKPGQPMVEILLAAARKYREQHPAKFE